MLQDAPELTAEQKLLHAIFAPCTEVERKAYMIEDVLDRIREKLQAASPYRSRMEAFGEIRVSFDRLWKMLVWDSRQHDEQDDSTDEDVAVDLALILAADLCRLLIDLAPSIPAPKSTQISGNSA